MADLPKPSDFFSELEIQNLRQAFALAQEGQGFTDEEFAELLCLACHVEHSHRGLQEVLLGRQTIDFVGRGLCIEPLSADDLEKRSKNRAAFHEAGHAVVALSLRCPVKKVSINADLEQSCRLLRAHPAQMAHSWLSPSCQAPVHQANNHDWARWHGC